MRLAEYGKGGHLVPLKEFMDIAGSDDPKTWVVKPHCPECGEEVHAYDKRGARGMRAVRDEVTKPRVKPGFSHYPVDDADLTSPVLTCPNSLRNDPRFGTPNLRDLIDHNTFHHNETERNKLALSEPKMARALAEIERHLMQRLTGMPIISGQNKEDLAQANKGLITLAGLAEHPWVMPYMKVLLVGSREREVRVGHGKKPRMNKVRFEGRGEQKLPVTFADGEKGDLIIPKSLVPGFVGYGGRFKAMEHPTTHEITSFPITRDFAVELYQRALEEERREQLRHPQTALDFSAKPEPSSPPAPTPEPAPVKSPVTVIKPGQMKLKLDS